MRKLFIDTSALAAMADSKDNNHLMAAEYGEAIIGKYQLILTNYILDELYTLLLMNSGYKKTVFFKRTLDQLLQQKLLEITWVSPEVAELAWKVFEQFNTDKQWSFTDCVSYIVMQQQDIQEVFTFDHHFSRMGFIRRP